MHQHLLDETVEMTCKLRSQTIGYLALTYPFPTYLANKLELQPNLRNFYMIKTRVLMCKTQMMRCVLNGLFSVHCILLKTIQILFSPYTRHMKYINWKGLKFPMTLTQIRKYYYQCIFIHLSTLLRLYSCVHDDHLQLPL